MESISVYFYSKKKENPSEFLVEQREKGKEKEAKSSKQRA